MKGIRASMLKITDMIESITPKTDPFQNFVCLKTLSGNGFGLESSGLGERYFDFLFRSLPQDDGFSGISLRKLVELQIRVKYNLVSSVESSFKEMQMAEDVTSIINTLLNPDYDSANTGIVSIVTGQPLIETPPQELNQFILLIIPFTLRFYEEM
jgi:hypothetical protein